MLWLPDSLGKCNIPLISKNRSNSVKPGTLRTWGPFLDSPENFSGTRSLLSNCNPLIFLHVFNIRKTKRIAKFEGLEPRRCEDIKAVVAPEIGPKSFGTFEKQAPCY